MEEDKKVDSNKVGNSVRQHPRPNRSVYSRTSNFSSGENSPQQGNTENVANRFGIRFRNMHESGHNSVSDNSPDVVASSPENSSSPTDYPNGSGLNGVRQLLDDVDSHLPNVVDASVSPHDTQSSYSTRNRNTSPTSHRGERRRARRRIQTHPNPGQSRAETFVRNASPSRQNRPYHGSGQHIPPLRFSAIPGVTSPATSPAADSTASRFVDGLFGSTGQLGPFPNPYLRGYGTEGVRGYGTEEEPFELSPGLSDDSSSPPAFDSQGSLQSDEEIARQLQQEEWEAAGNFSVGRHNPRPPRSGAFNTFHYHRRPRAPDLPPLRLTRAGSSSRVAQGPSGESSSQHFGGSGSQATAGPPVFRPPGHRRRSQDEPLPMRTRLDHWAMPPEELEGSYGNLALLTDLLSSYGFSDWTDIEALLNPGPVGQRPLIDPDFMDYESLLALGEQLGEVSKGMEQSEIDKLTIHRHKSSPSRLGASAAASPAPELPQCNICLSDYENGDEKRVLPCKHEFHRHCVDQWLKTNASCPVCRSEIKMKDS